MEDSIIDNKVYRNKGAKLGIGLGLATVLLTILPLYFFASASSFWLVIIGPVVTGFLLPLAVAVFLTLKLREMLGGFWSFRQAVTGIFMMMFVASIILSATSYVFEKFIQPDMKEKYIRNVANITIETMEEWSVDPDQIDAQVANIDAMLESAGEEATVGSMLKGLVISVIVIFLVSIIFASVFKKERPVFYTPADDPQQDQASSTQ